MFIFTKADFDIAVFDHRCPIGIGRINQRYRAGNRSANLGSTIDACRWLCAGRNQH